MSCQSNSNSRPRVFGAKIQPPTAALNAKEVCKKKKGWVAQKKGHGRLCACGMRAAAANTKSSRADQSSPKHSIAVLQSMRPAEFGHSRQPHHPAVWIRRALLQLVAPPPPPAVVVAPHYRMASKHRLGTFETADIAAHAYGIAIWRSVGRGTSSTSRRSSRGRTRSSSGWR